MKDKFSIIIDSTTQQQQSKSNFKVFGSLIKVYVRQ